jgi:hypothetical protein
VIDQAFARFDKKSFDNAIFYNREDGLRFELSEGKGESRIEMFLTAYKKCTSIVESAFSDVSSIVVCLAFPGNRFLSSLSCFRQLRDCQLDVPKNYESRREWIEEDEFNRIQIFSCLEDQNYIN